VFDAVFKMKECIVHTLVNLKKESNAVIFANGKLIPLQAWRGPKGSRRLRPADF
jgi:hypothetical protein